MKHIITWYIPNQITQQESQILKSILKAGLSQIQADKILLKQMKNNLWLRADKTKPETEAYFKNFSMVRTSLEKLRSYEKKLAAIQRKLRAVK